MPISGNPIQPDIVVVLSSGSSWIVPPNFDNLQNFVELIGGGGAGARPSPGINHSAGGGGGGAYERIQNYNTGGSASVAFVLGAGGLGGTAAGGDGGDTVWSADTASIAQGGSGGPRPTGGSEPFPGGAGGTGSFNGGGGGQSFVGGGPLFRGTGGGGAAGPSGSGQNGSGNGGRGGEPSGGLGGQQGTNIDNPPTDGGTGSVWLDTTTGEVAGSGGGGGGGAPQHSGALGGQWGAAGGGGGKTTDLSSARHQGGDGQQGVIVITYRSRLHQLQGTVIDESSIEMAALIQRLRGTVRDSDNTIGPLLRKVIFGQSVMMDEDVMVGKPTISYKLSAKLIDDDGVTGVPTFEFRLSAFVQDEDHTVASRLLHSVRIAGAALDDDSSKAFLRVITRFRGTLIDGDGGDNDGIVTGFVKFQGTVMDNEGMAHNILDPLRDIAFFVNRDAKQLGDSVAMDGEDFTHHNTLHGFRLKPITLDGTEFELIPIQINDEADFSITIRLTEEDLRALGKID